VLESCSGVYHKILNSTWPGSGSEGPASFTHSQDITGNSYEIVPLYRLVSNKLEWESNGLYFGETLPNQNAPSRTK